MRSLTKGLDNKMAGSKWHSFFLNLPIRTIIYFDRTVKKHISVVWHDIYYSGLFLGIYQVVSIQVCHTMKVSEKMCRVLT